MHNQILNLIMAQTTAHTFKNKKQICSDVTRSGQCFYIEAGAALLRRSVSFSDGRHRFVAELKTQGDLIGAELCFGGRILEDVELVALGAVKVGVVDRDRFTALYRDASAMLQAEIATQLMKQAADERERLFRLRVGKTESGTDKQVLALLGVCAGVIGVDVPLGRLIPLRVVDIAALVDLAPETCRRALWRLEEADVIGRHRRGWLLP